MGSAGSAETEPKNYNFLNCNRRILLKITISVSNELFIEIDNKNCKIVTFEVKRMKLHCIGYFLTFFEDMGKFFKLGKKVMKFIELLNLVFSMKM